jgi:hypothetical protein
MKNEIIQTIVNDNYDLVFNTLAFYFHENLSHYFIYYLMIKSDFKVEFFFSQLHFFFPTKKI